MSRNRCWRLTHWLASGEPLEASCFRWDEAEVPACGDGEVLVRTLCRGGCLTGVMFDRTGNYGLPFQVAIGALLAAFLLTSALPAPPAEG